MGRWSTGAETCQGSKRIELSFLIKKGYLQKGRRTQGSIEWTHNGRPNGDIKIFCSYTEEKFIRLVYKLTDHREGKEYNYDYKIYLTSIPSNLGKGEVLYFICPETRKKVSGSVFCLWLS